MPTLLSTTSLAYSSDKFQSILTKSHISLFIYFNPSLKFFGKKIVGTFLSLATSKILIDNGPFCYNSIV